MATKRIGILTGGGDVPGLNAVINRRAPPPRDDARPAPAQPRRAVVRVQRHEPGDRRPVEVHARRDGRLPRREGPLAARGPRRDRGRGIERVPARVLAALVRPVRLPRGQGDRQERARRRRVPIPGPARRRRRVRQPRDGGRLEVEPFRPRKRRWRQVRNRSPSRRSTRSARSSTSCA